MEEVGRAMNGFEGLSFPTDERATSERLVIGVWTLTLRPAGEADSSAFRDFYAETRAAEPLVANMAPLLREAFLDQQFGLQHRYFIAAFPNASFLAVTFEQERAEPIGYLYIDRSDRDWHLIEIRFDPRWCGRGIGSAAITWLQRQLIERRGGGLTLNVAATNFRAIALYRRLGFIDAMRGDPLHHAMMWVNPVQ